MEYTINNLAKLASVSTRTLRYYDEIDLLKPCRINSSGYRIYGQREVDELQQIMFYRELGLPLEKIKEIINKDNFDYKSALNEHREKLLLKQEQINTLIKNIDKTLKSLEGKDDMSDKEKFEGFKEKIIKENEDKYGKEIREKYGEDRVKDSYKKVSKLTKEQWDEIDVISNSINENLRRAMEIGNPECELARVTVKLHYKWLSFFGKYSKEAHLGLGQMYVEDERFTEYYEKNAGVGAAKFLRDAIVLYYKE